MIRYDLICEREHRFDGWFRDSGGYDEQRKRGAVQCPHCGSGKVAKAPMAPGLPARSNRVSNARPAPRDAKAAAVREAVRRLRLHVETNADYVGREFPEEARRIHYKEAEERGIYGEASLEDAKLLHEEGIEVLPLPPVPEDHN